MEKFFKLSERGTNVKIEMTAGITTFFAMVYILMINANMFAILDGVTYGAVYIATAISAVIGTVLIGLLANLPLAQASGMGLNAFAVYTVCGSFGFSYANAMAMILIDGIVFLLLTVTGLRKKIFAAIPVTVRSAISAGIGLFIAFLGLQNAGIVVADSSTGVTLGSFNLMGAKTWGDIMPMVVTIAAFFIIVILAKKNVRGAVLWGILAGMGLYYVLGLTVPGFYANLGISMSSPFAAFKEFGTQALGKVFAEGFDFSAYVEAHGNVNLIFTIVSTSLAFCMVDMFDTLGTLFAACDRGGLLENDEIPNVNKAMLADAIATTAGAICGTSTVTTFVESTAGVAEGGRTGLTSMFTAACFAIAMFFSPIAQLVPSCATAAALIYVGVLMMSALKKIDWVSTESAVPAFLTMAMMPFTYNISYGIAFGLLAYLVISLFTGKAKEIKIWTWVITILFALMLLLTH